MRCEVRGRAQLFDGAEDARGAGMGWRASSGVGLKRRCDGAQMEGKQGTRGRGVKKQLLAGLSLCSGGLW